MIRTFPTEKVVEIMNIGQAFAIFKQIKSDKYSHEQKSMAIYLVIHCETINGITKNELLCALEWLYDHKLERTCDELRSYFANNLEGGADDVKRR
jgi:hypothetical protein